MWLHVGGVFSGGFIIIFNIMAKQDDGVGISALVTAQITMYEIHNKQIRSK